MDINENNASQSYDTYRLGSLDRTMQNVYQNQ